MTIKEMEKIAIDHKWAFGPCGDDMWHEVEQTYMRTNLDKREITWLYWMHTGLYEQLAQAVKVMIEEEKRVANSIKIGAESWTVGLLAGDLKNICDAVTKKVFDIRDLYIAENKKPIAK